MRFQELQEASRKPVGIAQIDYVEQGQKIAKFLQKKCLPWLTKSGNSKLAVYRGVTSNRRENLLAYTIDVRQNRRPKDTQKERHNFFNKVIAAAGGVANRSNAVFVSGDIDTAQEYGDGEAYVLLPIGNFKYTWSPRYQDWTAHFDPPNYENPEQYAKNIVTDRDLIRAIKSNAEIMVHCQQVVMINASIYHRIVVPTLKGKTPKVKSDYNPDEDYAY